MTKREKVIMGLMLTVVIFGAYSFLFSPSKNIAVDSEKVISELNKVIADLAKKINRDGQSNVAYILQKAAEKWEKDPFVQSSGHFDVADKEESYQSGLSGSASIFFSGFIHAGDKMLAIINGLEYEEGDVVGNGGYSVKKISRGKVILESGSGEDLVVLIEEY